MPQWSPDGKKIVYFDPARSSKAFGNLVVVDTSGLPVEKYAVATEDEHGIPIGGMRAVEDIGWFDRENLFAAGSVNPYISEFKTINTNSRKVAGFGGTGFSTCKQSGVVAFWQPVFPQTKSFSLETSNSGLSLFEFPDKDQLPTLGISTRWSNTCTAVAFIDPMPPRHLVVVSLNRDSRVILLPGEIKSDALRAVPEGFLLGEAGELLYREAASTLINTPAEILQRIQRVSESRKKVEKLLGVDDAAWYGGADDR